MNIAVISSYRRDPIMREVVSTEPYRPLRSHNTRMDVVIEMPRKQIAIISNEINSLVTRNIWHYVYSLVRPINWVLEDMEHK